MIETVKKTFMLLSAIAFMASCDDKQPQDTGEEDAPLQASASLVVNADKKTVE